MSSVILEEFATRLLTQSSRDTMPYPCLHLVNHMPHMKRTIFMKNIFKKSRPTILRTFALALCFTAVTVAAEDRSILSRGAYLVRAMACADCHTPWKLGSNGPAPDFTQGLSGHPQAMPLPAPPTAQGPWVAGNAATNTAFWGPWGVSYAGNLTPDPETGIGKWRPEDFVTTIRSGKHLGFGRPLQPPMPWPAFAQLNDADLKAMFAYLQSQPAIKNRVPTSTPR